MTGTLPEEHVWAYWEQVAARILARHLPPDQPPDSISGCDDEARSTVGATVPRHP